MADTRVPSFTEEKLLRQQGYNFIAGIDEVGRGALAGPVMAAAVILPKGLKATWKKKVRDSKLLSQAQREGLFEPIRKTCNCYRNRLGRLLDDRSYRYCPGNPDSHVPGNQSTLPGSRCSPH